MNRRIEEENRKGRLRLALLVKKQQKKNYEKIAKIQNMKTQKHFASEHRNIVRCICVFFCFILKCVSLSAQCLRVITQTTTKLFCAMCVPIYGIFKYFCGL